MTQLQTGCLHDYSLTTQNLKILEKADLLIVNGLGMESFLDKVTSNYPKLKVIDASQDAQFMFDPNTGDPNPHVWVSILGAMKQVENITQALTQIYPIHEAGYKMNAESYMHKLSVLQVKMQKALSNLPYKQIVTFHEAFSYFASEFNLEVIAVIESEPGKEPSPKELSDLISKVKQMPRKVLFVEPQYTAKTADLIAQETGAVIYTLDPVVTGDGNLDSYLTSMEQNLETFKRALQ